jgi:hypothetical protein
MNLTRSILPFLILPANLGQFPSSQVPQTPSGRLPKGWGKICEQRTLYTYIKSVLDTNNFPGLSLGIVFPNDEVGFAAWGNRAEEGDPVNEEVCFPAFLRYIVI